MSEAVSDQSAVDADVVVIGTGVTGIYQTYRALEEGFTVKVLEAGAGVGGTWFWNRYPEARFDSESYTYGYLFSKDLWDEWEWSERFAGQPEIERYFNYVVDKFDLRQHIRFDSKVDSSTFDEDSGVWTTTTEDGFSVRSRFLVAATGVLSVPFYPNVEGREDFQGESYHTGRWPSTPVDFTGKKVAVIGTGSSGVQLIPVVAKEAASLTVYQRTANWCTPLNNAPISAEEQADLKANYESIKETLDASVSGFLHKMDYRKFEDDAEVDRLPFYEKMWNSPGFEKLTTHYIDMTLNPVANKEWSDFVANKIRDAVDDPETAEKLIPKDHGYGGKRPPFVTNYFQVYNQPNVKLVSLKETPILRVTAAGIETVDGVEEFDIIVWSTGYDFGTGALNRLGIRGRNGLELKNHWGDGPRTFLGTVAAGFPNFFFPGGPHGSTGNNPRYTGDQVDFVMDALIYARDNAIDVMEASAAAEEEWTAMMDASSVYSSFTDKSYFYGANIPGKPVKQLLNPTGRPTLQQLIAKTVEGGFGEFVLVRRDKDDRVTA
ncbi:NAD(P)/FAD-dependent oxidoreductase [Rhodococcus sp. 14-2470-1a]|uniref:flavin-containing monooxygenase n=1 Tax=Rhodococcus sp. 14-2470-1a TaxID=2023150 RepID=UPI000B9A19E9|nr:NAD(P)/FAD-dependent oxidoreductase [Rhodococcus sp. 14-2470-1a]OZF45767.1 steroid monooxygenase [Rhodococcus sp. 14-2470-1a]